MTDLHTQLRAAIERELATARTVQTDSVDGTISGQVTNGASRQQVAAMLAFWNEQTSPAKVIRRCEADLRRLERHAPSHDDVADWLELRLAPGEQAICDVSAETWPCDDIRDLAYAYALDIPGSQT